MPANKLGNLLTPCKNGDLGKLVERARHMGELTDVLCRAISEQDRAGIVAANVRESGELVVICASPAWASRLRYESETLLGAARAAGVEVSSCAVRVRSG